MKFNLSKDQENAYAKLTQFILHPTKDVMVLNGYAGTGKTTLLNYLLKDLPNIYRTQKLIDLNYEQKMHKITATTNQAVDVLKEVTGNMGSCTIQSLLGFKPIINYQTGESTLEPTDRSTIIENKLIIIDEASFLNLKFLRDIFEWIKDCKILFVLDAAQLIDHKSRTSAVISAGFETVELTQVMRHDSLILDWATMFREAVFTSKFKAMPTDNKTVIRLDRTNFNNAVLDEFSNPYWTMKDSRLLFWRNKSVTKYNNAIANKLTGSPIFSEGDLAVCNDFFKFPNDYIRTDQVVTIESVQPNTAHGLRGHYYGINGYKNTAFCPESLEEKHKLMSHYKSNENWFGLKEISENWIDLRPRYASTVNKAQGRTFKKVFIDIDDISACNIRHQKARLLYTAASRPSQQIIFTGNLI